MDFDRPHYCCVPFSTDGREAFLEGVKAGLLIGNGCNKNAKIEVHDYIATQEHCTLTSIMI
jgi:hypothetical protein